MHYEFTNRDAGRATKQAECELLVYLPTGRGIGNTALDGSDMAVLDAAGDDTLTDHIDLLDGDDAFGFSFMRLPAPPSPGLWRCDVTAWFDKDGTVAIMEITLTKTTECAWAQ